MFSAQGRVRNTQDVDLSDAPDEPDTPVPRREYAPIPAFIPGEGIETNCLMFYVGALIDKNAGIQMGPHWRASHSMSLRRNG
jgi:hypothetical protein